MRLVKLQSADRDLARALFALLAALFEDTLGALSDDYVDRLLARDDFWAIAAFDGDKIIGGVTAYTLPMTRREASEIFIYDIAVRTEYRRKGVGRRLVTELQNSAGARGIREMFVAADNEDVHALDFYRALGGAASPVTFFLFENHEVESKRSDAGLFGLAAP